MVHVVDADEELMWTVDHNPPMPTTQWKPGQTIEYTRTVFVPVYPYVGEASIQIGLYSTQNQKRLPLAGEDAGQRAYKVAHVQLQPQTENVFTVFKDGWHPAEVAEHNAHGRVAVDEEDGDARRSRIPKKDCVFYLDVDNPGECVQRAAAGAGDAERRSSSTSSTLEPEGQAACGRFRSSGAARHRRRWTEMEIGSTRRSCRRPCRASNSKDPRELGVRVFHAFVDAR